MSPVAEYLQSTKDPLEAQFDAERAAMAAKSSGPAANEFDPEQDEAASETGTLLPSPLAHVFLLAGKATFTMVSKATGKRFTFKVQRPKADAERTAQYGPARRVPYFVSVLNGPSNTSDYAYLGQIWQDAEKLTYEIGRKSRIGADAPSQRAALWLAKALNRPELLDQCTIYHMGACGRCGRALTVPESVASGIGPECATRM